MNPDPEITGLTPDSRAVSPGFLFAALPGVAADGAAFIAQAEAKGAAAVLAGRRVKTELPLIVDEEPRRRLAQMAARFYPRQPRVIAGVTGTNGKTSTAIFSAALWQRLGFNAGSLGTLGARAATFERKLHHTTPEPVTLHETLEQMADAGVTHLAMEASSHALAQYRADGVRFSAAAFTNITQDHLDYHADFADYFRTKQRLFLDLLPDAGAAVVNMDGEGSDEIAKIARARGVRTITTGARGETLRLAALKPQAGGLDISVEAERRRYDLTLPLIGAFQAENALLAAGIVISSGAAAQDVLPLLARLPGVPGRMQHAADVNGAGVYIDYAHTPDAVETALAAIRPHAAGRIIAIIGAGGDRDRKKRPLMGAAAARGADHVIVTDDNPRTEDPASIRREVLAGCGGAEEIGDRAEAIAKGVAMLREGDVLLIAGKGHETGQIVGGETLPFDDADVARRAAREVGR
ncbi:MAG: UDP-N-acetylmuramoyl-L-alanyl-D-glutamate--2,6-diaminopimelate ligase [Alphaproteobacteria bacterium RIFCSPHIGHO2_12_FULL_63_12]|nr:MAG: UDP-N-acetylmuramoyl-L-alanyl-D-glutamate--2,6-diaminopimelate ligase [Alphaproteobacteria bacterium RIFCSPHIGHO2_12_FULL_63_12]